GAFQNLFQSVR
nr:Chain B, Androgen receptor, activator peptide [Homo sapiens]3V4A_B Chain B, Androgen receptor [Homo sapiens]